MTGQCYCGKVQYEVHGPLKFVAHDHCSICRRITGAAFLTWCGAKEEQLKITAGHDNLTSFKSTPQAERHFCKTCGSHLFFRAARWPGEVHFTLGSVKDSNIRPQAHVFFSDKTEWIDIQDALPKFGGKTGTEPLT